MRFIVMNRLHKAFCASFLFLVFQGSAQIIPLAKGTRIFLVRHAEKDTGNNPALSKAGKERAGDLYRMLQGEQIDKVYFSRYRRTRQTADSLLSYTKADTFSYKADTSGEGLAESLKLTATPISGEHILIIGHSNTIPAIIRKLGVADFEPNELPDNEYDNLYVITFSQGKPSVKRMKYGKQSRANSSKMDPLQ